jgi:hypothetical protein
MQASVQSERKEINRQLRKCLNTTLLKRPELRKLHGRVSNGEVLVVTRRLSTG